MKTAKKPTVITVKNGLGCINCGEHQELVFPIRLDFYVESAKAFERLHKKCKPSERGKKRFEFSTPDEWINSWDTGVSSETIYEVFTGRQVETHGIPRDAADFGRCHRLLAKFPAWRESLPSVAKRFPEWAPIVERWMDIEKLYEEELPTGKAPKTCALMADILGLDS